MNQVSRKINMKGFIPLNPAKWSKEGLDPRCPDIYRDEVGLAPRSPDTDRGEVGFTIIELLISVVIISIIMMISFAGYVNFNRKQSLINAGQSLRNIIRDVQSRAYNSEMDCSNNACDCKSMSSNALVGWVVDFSSNKIFGECRSVNQPNAVITFSPKDFELSAEITIIPYLTPQADPPEINFHAPFNNIPSGKICLSHSSQPDSYYIININNAGVTTSQDSLESVCVNPGGTLPGNPGGTD